MVKKFFVISLLFLFGGITMGSGFEIYLDEIVQEKSETVELTKQEALDLVTLRTIVEQKQLEYNAAQKEFNDLLLKIYAAYGVSVDDYGWKPTTGQLVKLPKETNASKSTDTNAGR